MCSYWRRPLNTCTCTWIKHITLHAHVYTCIYVRVHHELLWSPAAESWEVALSLWGIAEPWLQDHGEVESTVENCKSSWPWHISISPFNGTHSTSCVLYMCVCMCIEDLCSTICHEYIYSVHYTLMLHFWCLILVFHIHNDIHRYHNYAWL